MWLKYADEQLTLDKVKALPQEETIMAFNKPRGFWITDDTEDNWYRWCVSEEFCLEDLTHKHQIELDETNIRFLRSAEDIDKFSDEWIAPCNLPGVSGVVSLDGINWPEAVKKYDGLIITPYIWERRLSLFGKGKTDWYYPWDCASGCIWNPKAIKSIKLLSVDPIPLKEKVNES